MAEFDPTKYQRIVKPGVEQAGFDPSAYQQISKPKISKPKTAMERFLEGARERFLFASDVGGGARAAFQNPAAALTSSLPESLQIPRYDPQPQTQYGRFPVEAGKILGSFVPGIAAERAAIGALGAARVPQALARVAGGAAGGAASAPSVDVSPGLGAAIGGTFSAVPEALIHGVGSFVGKGVTPEQFESARQAVPPTIRAPIGELADSPRAKKAFGGLRAIALSGADEPYIQLSEHLNEGVKNLVKDAPAVENPSQFVYDDLKQSYEAAKKNTDRAYLELGKSADISKTPFVRDKYESAIDEELKRIKKRSINKTKIKSYKDAVDVLEDFRSTNIKSFEDAIEARFAINDEINEVAGIDKKKKVFRVLQGMKSGLDDSIAESAAQNPTLMDMHNTANNARIYQGTFEKLNRRDATPFHKIYSKGGDPGNLIGSHIRRSSKGSDYSGLLRALTDKLSPESKDVLAKAHLQPQEDTSLAKQLSQLRALSPGQRNLLFDDKADLANDLSKLSGVFKEAGTAGFTPKTGWSSGKVAQAMAELLGGVGLASTIGAPHAAATAAAIPVIGQLAQRGLRSTALKDAYSKYLSRKTGAALAKPTKKERLARTLALAAIGGDQDVS